MSNLIEEFGRTTFNDRFAGSFFTGPQGQVCAIRSASQDGTVHVFSYTGPVSKVVRDTLTLPYDFFKDMSSFSMGRLGWRVAQKGKWMAHLSRDNRSYHRGLSLTNLVRQTTPLTDWMMRRSEVNADYYNREGTLAILLTNPKYLTLAEGLSFINEGRIVAFPINEHMAVSVHDSDEHLALLFKNNVVGTVHFDGRVECSIPNSLTRLENAA